MVRGLGAWALLVAGLVIGLIVTIHFSPGAVVVTAVGALRAANAEKRRLRALVGNVSSEKAKPTRPAPATSDLLTRSAARFATAPAPPGQKSLWQGDEPEEEATHPTRAHPTEQAPLDPEPTP